mmetsp:Transcript_49790/g.160984  ORF Transcript_49790/g.160984 Transcript_49790/m.160984 type:complete len:308 (+) Transcript_49790:2523-3446(+)
MRTRNLQSTVSSTARERLSSQTGTHHGSRHGSRVGFPHHSSIPSCSGQRTRQGAGRQPLERAAPNRLMPSWTTRSRHRPFSGRCRCRAASPGPGWTSVAASSCCGRFLAPSSASAEKAETTETTETTASERWTQSWRRGRSPRRAARHWAAGRSAPASPGRPTSLHPSCRATAPGRPAAAVQRQRPPRGYCRHRRRRSRRRRKRARARSLCCRRSRRTSPAPAPLPTSPRPTTALAKLQQTRATATLQTAPVAGAAAGAAEARRERPPRPAAPVAARRLLPRRSSQRDSTKPAGLQPHRRGATTECS